MSETGNVIGKVEKVVVSGPFEGKNGKPDYDRLTYTIQGKNYTKLTNVGIGSDLNEGDNVHVFFTSTQNGKFTNNNIIKIELTDKAPNTNTEKKTASKTSGSKTTSQSTTTVGSQITTSKDISMEVSGLLQSIIIGGGFKLNEPGVIEVVETGLRSALQLKRKVAQELETKGTV